MKFIFLLIVFTVVTFLIGCAQSPVIYIDTKCAKLWSDANNYCSQFQKESCENKSFDYLTNYSTGEYPIKCQWHVNACKAQAICQ